MNYIIGVTLNYLLLMFLYLVGVNPVSLYENIPYYFMFNIFQLCIMHPLTHAAGNFYRNLIHLNIIPFYTHKHNQKVLHLIAIELILCGLIFIFNVTLGNLIGYSYSVILFNGILFSLFFLSTGVISSVSTKPYRKTMNSRPELLTLIHSANMPANWNTYIKRSGALNMTI